MSTGAYNEKRGRGQRHFGKCFGVMIVMGTLFAFFGQPIYAQVAPPQTTSPPAPTGPVTIKNIQPLGTGCPPGTVAHSISPEKQTLTLAYAEYTAEIGVGIPLIESGKTCNVTLEITYPQGYRFGIFAVNFKGFARLDAGVVGTLAARYFFQGQSLPVEFVLQSSDGLQFFNDYNVRDEIIATQVMYGPCGGGGTLIINTDVRLQGTGTGAMLADTTTGKFQQIYTLDWQQC